ncbi:PREDICTED: probable RNA-binding protein EIF1AD [Priapulus caudatus]|uniref:Probable RNA-binding protein EIF1AD n=1 Tax=Priapulus caudatus TaxID=37621 RepID=A0ABM1ENU9_PRICU|nr:PREDICTED: probable RNA-binding protein EIF1AD [Priapulus caudatus]
MSRATKRKHVVQEVLNDYILPSAEQFIVQVVASKGNNLHEVVTDSGDQFLVTMPSKFRKNVWIKRSDFLLVEPIEEGDKVKAEIISILYKNQVKYIKEEGKWPPGFSDVKKEKNDGANNNDGEARNTEDEEDSDSDLFVNTNRHAVAYEESDDDTDDDDEDVDDELV